MNFAAGRKPLGLMEFQGLRSEFAFPIAYASPIS
jgi:hypothetical protein